MNPIVESLRGFYRFALARGYVNTSPLPKTVPQVPPQFVPYIYSHDEVRRLLEATVSREHRNLSAITCRTLLLLLYGTGLRISEALGLDVTDVNPLMPGFFKFARPSSIRSVSFPLGRI